MTSGPLARASLLSVPLAFRSLAAPRIPPRWARLRCISACSAGLAPQPAGSLRASEREPLNLGPCDAAPAPPPRRQPVVERPRHDDDDKSATHLWDAARDAPGHQSRQRRHGRPAHSPPQPQAGRGAQRPMATRDFAKIDLSGQGRLTAAAWQRLKEERLIYQQWGYCRHQYPKSQLVEARRAFKWWKMKLQRVLEASGPASWPWLEEGKSLCELETAEAVRNAWEALEPEARRQRWPQVMLSTMHLCPDKTRLLLGATMDPLPPGYALHDVLLFIAQRLDPARTMPGRERTAEADEVLHLVTELFEGAPAGHVPLSQRAFGILARKLPADQVRELYGVAKRSGCKLHTNTLMHMARKLAGDAAHKETALAILNNLADDGLDLNDARPASVATALLHCKSNDGSAPAKRPFSPKDALQQLVERGLSPNVATSTALLDSLCQRGEADEAIRLALLFAESGVQLDTKAWATVFRGAKTSLKAANLVRAFDVARAADAPYIDVLNNALHSVLYFANMESRDRRQRAPWVLPAFGPMLRVYAKKFDLAPLQWWLPEPLAPLLAAPRAGAPWDFEHSVLPVVDAFFSAGGGGGGGGGGEGDEGEGEAARMQPSSTTVATMLRAYIKNLRQPHEVAAAYALFRARLAELAARADEAEPEPEPSRRLVDHHGSLIHDAFIMAMTEHRGPACPALDVFADMLGGGAAAARQTARHPPPSVLTFTILLRGLLARRDWALARHVLGVMGELGVAPNLVTWNTLTRGFAAMQDAARTVTALQDMEAAGFRPDALTFKAFARLRDQAAALRIMEGIIDANRRSIARGLPPSRA